MKKQELKIAIVLVCTNEKHYLKECIDSLNDQTYLNFQICLVDNNSTDGSVEFVSKNYPDVLIIKNNQNVGFAKANNIGMKNVFDKNFDVCILLNPDTKSDRKMVENLIATYLSKKEKNKVGLVQPLLLLYDKSNLINSSGNPIHFLGFGYAGNYLKNKNIVNNDKEVLSVTGGATLITKNFFYDIGGFDESFFMYCEDQNMCWQGLLQGYKYYLSHKSIVYHKYKFNRNKRKMFYTERNRLIMFFENYSLKTILLLFPILIFNELLVLFYSLIKGWFILKIKSYFSFFKNIKKVFLKRKVVQNKRKVPDNEILKKMIYKLDFESITDYLFKPVNFIYSFYFYTIKFFI